MKQFFVFLVLVVCGILYRGDNAWAAQDKFHVDAGNGYIELPVDTRIMETYTKDGDFAFVVNNSYTKDLPKIHIVDFKGHILWVSKGRDVWPSPDEQAYLKENGWIKAIGEKFDTPILFQNNQTVKLISREDIRQ